MGTRIAHNMNHQVHWYNHVPKWACVPKLGQKLLYSLPPQILMFWDPWLNYFELPSWPRIVSAQCKELPRCRLANRWLLRWHNLLSAVGGGGGWLLWISGSSSSEESFPLERGLPPRFYIVIRQTKCSSAKGELLWKDLRGILRSDNLRRLMSAKQRNQNPDLD